MVVWHAKCYVCTLVTVLSLLLGRERVAIRTLTVGLMPRECGYMSRRKSMCVSYNP